MLPTPAPIQIARPLPLATGATLTYYMHVSQAAKIRSAGIVLHGTTINSAADVVVTIEKLPVGGGAPVPVCTVNIPNGTATGNVALGSAIAVPIDLAIGDAVRGTVTTAATVAGGDGYISLALSFS